MVCASDSFPAVPGSSLAQTPYVDLLWVVPNSYPQRTVRFEPFGVFNPSPYVRESRFRNPGNFSLWNPESWALESGIQL